MSDCPSTTLSAPPLHAPADGPTVVGTSPDFRPAAVPLSLPEYEILDELGRGGMGVVYKARQRNLNRLVALKVILAGPYASELDKGRFKLEAESAARLHHPNIVQVHDVGEHAGFAFIAFELIEGVTLRQFQDGRPLGGREAAHIVAAVARAVHHAHENGIVHRDLKPGNILMPAAGGQESGTRTRKPGDDVGGTRSGASERTPDAARLSPKVTDFGLAKELDTESGLTLSGMACGTPNYMSPEQVRGVKNTVGPRSDVYALGAILFEMLTGRPPFAGADAVGIMDLILNAEPPSVRRTRPDAPRDLEVIAAKCLEKDPARRYPSAAAAADDLDRYIAGRPVLARAVGPVERGWRWCRRNPWAAALLIVTSVGFATTAGLALKLTQSEGVERAARSDADDQRVAAELARDQLHAALETAKAATARAHDLRTAADEQTKLAKAEQRRAEENLRLARSVLRNTMDEFSKQPMFQDAASRDLRAVLLRNTRAFVRQVAAPDTRDTVLLEELTNLTGWVALMENLNGNLATSATEYRAAADLARRWAAADPDDQLAQLKLADALTNAGRAEYDARQPERAEADFRAALKVTDALLAGRPRQDTAYFQAQRGFSPLVVLLRDAGRLPEAVATSRLALDRCHEQVARFGLDAPIAAHLAEVLFTLASDLIRSGLPEVAECHLIEAIDLFDSYGASTEPRAPLRLGASDCRLLLAQLYLDRKHIQEAHQTFHLAAGLMKKPTNTTAERLQIARVESAHGVALRQWGDVGNAEPLLDRAIRAAEPLRRPPATAARAIEVWVTAMTHRAHLYNTTKRHKEAAAEWAKLAAEDPNMDARVQHSMFVLQSNVFAGDWKTAATGAAKMDAGERPGWYLMDLARVWCRIAKAAAADATLSQDERAAQSDAFVAKAVKCLERAKAQDFFKTPRMLEMVETDADYVVVRGRFDPRD